MPAKTPKSPSLQAPKPAPRGAQLVIVESPAKAKTISKYLGPGFRVEASRGHIRDLPKGALKQPKGAPKLPKQPVPGVNLEKEFEPTYVVADDRRAQVAELKKIAKDASEIWFATDLDREGEAIAWHLAELLGVDPAKAKRVEFDEITRSAILKAFQNPRAIDINRVNAQQARRILDRIVGYMVSPVLWKKIAGGLSAGRVQSVALKLIVDREREIRAFQPDEHWQVEAAMTPDAAKGGALAKDWTAFMSRRDERNKAPTVKEQAHWLTERGGIECELVALGGAPFDVGREVPKYEDAAALANAKSQSNDFQLPDWVQRKTEEDKKSKTPIPQPARWYDAGESVATRVQAVAVAVGMENVSMQLTEDAESVGFSRWQRTVRGTIGAAVRYRVKSIDRSGTSSKPRAPFITSTLQSSASYALSFGTDRTMRVAQLLYQGVHVPGEGLVGLITYMRTDSTNLSGEALGMVRDFISTTYGTNYLPESPRFYGSSNKSAQEAHEAIRPTNVQRTPAQLRGAMDDDLWRLYNLIWQRFVACQMNDARYDSTSVLLERSDANTGAIFKANGRVQTFDGYTVTGIRGEGDDQELPAMKQGQDMAPFWLDPQQKFSSSPSRFNEASLVRELEKQGIGRPSTYASIINTIEARKYVEQISRAFHATDIGIAVCAFLEQPFKGGFMDVGYTRRIEEEFDEIAEGTLKWQTMLHDFYTPFARVVGGLHDGAHVKSVTDPAPYACPICGRRCEYRLGKTGKFLSCSGYNEKVPAAQPPAKVSAKPASQSKRKTTAKPRKPKMVPACSYAAPVNRQLKPMLPEKVDIKCPVDGAPMILRTGRFGDFLTSVNRETDFILNIDKKGGIKFPSPPALLTDLPCPQCGTLMNLRSGKRGPWLGCSSFPKCRGRESWVKIAAEKQQQLEKSLAMHAGHQPIFAITALDDTPLKEGTPVVTLIIPGEEAKLKLHAEYEREQRTMRASA